MGIQPYFKRFLSNILSILSTNPDQPVPFLRIGFNLNDISSKLSNSKLSF